MPEGYCVFSKKRGEAEEYRPENLYLVDRKIAESQKAKGNQYFSEKWGLVPGGKVPEGE